MSTYWKDREKQREEKTAVFLEHLIGECVNYLLENVIIDCEIVSANHTSTWHHHSLGVEMKMRRCDNDEVIERYLFFIIKNGKMVDPKTSHVLFDAERVINICKKNEICIPY